MIDLTLNGFPVRSRVCGPENGLPLILVHGAANDAHAWHDLAPHLVTAGLRGFAPDLPGHGASGGPPLAGIEAISAWINLFAEALGLQHFALAGHSMGAMVALETAATAQDRVSHLMLLGATLPMSVSPHLLELAETEPDAACRLVTLWSHTPGFFLNGDGGHGLWGAGKTLAIMRRNHATLANDLKNCARYQNGKEAASRVKCPSFLILGQRDRMTPLRSTQELSDALPQIKRHEIADCGHAMMVEKPEAVANAMIQALRSS